MKKLLSFILVMTVIIFFVTREGKKNEYVCKNYDKTPTVISVRIQGKRLTMGTQELKYCESIGNQDIYHSSCTKNEYGNYENSVRFDTVIKELNVIGSGGMTSVDLYSCEKRR
jgi:hypothetical protein